MKKMKCVYNATLVALVSVVFTCPAYSAIVINEFLADVPLGLVGDANGDGVRHATDDEFVEIFNTASIEENISLWSLWDKTALRHRFADGTILPALGRWVVFGGGSLINFMMPAEIASEGGLSLNNTEDEIVLRDGLGQVIDHVIYGSDANQDQSVNRFPEGTGEFRLHSEISSFGLPFSPGTNAEGVIDEVVNETPDSTDSPDSPDTPEIPETPETPEPPSLLLLLASALPWIWERVLYAKRIIPVPIGNGNR